MLQQIVDDISNNDRAAGWMLQQMLDVAHAGFYYSALSSLFVSIEQILRYAVEAKDKDRLEDLIQKAQKLQLLDRNDCMLLDKFRYYRNKYMHSDFHANAFNIDGMIYPVNDEGTAELIYSELAGPSLILMQKLVKQD